MELEGCLYLAIVRPIMSLIALLIIIGPLTLMLVVYCFILAIVISPYDVYLLTYTLINTPFLGLKLKVLCLLLIIPCICLYPVLVVVITTIGGIGISIVTAIHLDIKWGFEFEFDIMTGYFEYLVNTSYEHSIIMTTKPEGEFYVYDISILLLLKCILVTIMVIPINIIIGICMFPLIIPTYMRSFIFIFKGTCTPIFFIIGIILQGFAPIICVLTFVLIPIVLAFHGVLFSVVYYKTNLTEAIANNNNEIQKIIKTILDYIKTAD